MYAHECWHVSELGCCVHRQVDKSCSIKRRSKKVFIRINNQLPQALVGQEPTWFAQMKQELLTQQEDPHTFLLSDSDDDTVSLVTVQDEGSAGDEVGTSD